MVGRLQYLRFCLFEMYVNVVFGIRYLYSAVSLTLVKEQRFIKIIYYYSYSTEAFQSEDITDPEAKQSVEARCVVIKCLFYVSKCSADLTESWYTLSGQQSWLSSA